MHQLLITKFIKKAFRAFNQYHYLIIIQVFCKFANFSNKMTSLNFSVKSGKLNFVCFTYSIPWPFMSFLLIQAFFLFCQIGFYKQIKDPSYDSHLLDLFLFSTQLFHIYKFWFMKIKLLVVILRGYI